MDADGCGWVRWGVGGTGNTKTSQSGDIWGLTGQDLAPMAGEISPDMMFWEGCKKMANMVVDDHSSVRMGAGGLVGMRGTQNSKKKFENARILQYLATHDRCAKISLTVGLPKKGTERGIDIILGGQCLQRACI